MQRRTRRQSSGAEAGTAPETPEAEVWVVELFEAGGASCVEEMFRVAAEDCARMPRSSGRVQMKLVTVTTRVPSGLGPRLPVSFVGTRAAKAHEAQLFDLLVKPILATPAGKKVKPKYLPVRNDKREEGLVTVMHKLKASRLYVPVKTAALVKHLALQMPSGCRIIGVCGGERMAEETVEHIEVFDSRDSVPCFDSVNFSDSFSEFLVSGTLPNPSLLGNARGSFQERNFPHLRPQTPAPQLSRANTTVTERRSLGCPKELTRANTLKESRHLSPDVGCCTTLASASVCYPTGVPMSPTILEGSSLTSPQESLGGFPFPETSIPFSAPLLSMSIEEENPKAHCLHAHTVMQEEKETPQPQTPPSKPGRLDLRAITVNTDSSTWSVGSPWGLAHTPSSVYLGCSDNPATLKKQVSQGKSCRQHAKEKSKEHGALLQMASALKDRFRKVTCGPKSSKGKTQERQTLQHSL